MRERRASFPRKRGQMRNALGVRATPAREPPRVPASAPLSCSLPERPAVPGPLAAWHTPAPHLGYSQSPGLPVVFHHGGCDGAIPGQGGGQGWGGEGVGKKGRGVPGTSWGQRKRHPNPPRGVSPPSPLPTLRSNQEEQEEEEDEQNGRRHQPGRKRGRAQARTARSPLRPPATACKGVTGEENGPLRKPCAQSQGITSSLCACWPAEAQPAQEEIALKDDRCEDEISGNCGPELEKERSTSLEDFWEL